MQDQPQPEQFYSSEESENENNLAAELQQWALLFFCTHRAVDGLLKILQKYGHQELPKTARTLLGTQRIPEPNIISGGQYHYLGFAENLRKILCKKPELDQLTLAINIDGLPVAKSGSVNTSLWPVLCRVVNAPEFGVFPVALCLTSAKPDGLRFLDDAIAELNMLIASGLEFEQRRVSVNLGHVVCDAPAKAMCKVTKYFSGYFGCDKCEIEGNYKYRKVIYPRGTAQRMRTNDSFRSQRQAQHHVGDSPFCLLPQLDMVKCFPIDYMHQVLLGVQKKLLYMWVTEPKGAGRLKAEKVEVINQSLIKLSSQTPNDFARKPRSLKHLPHFKATEFRTFLIYTGKVVLQRVLSPERYAHFLCLSVAITILLNTDLVDLHLGYANELLQHFVYGIEKIYGEKYLVYNVHSLLHIAEQCNIFGNLNNCSAFEFENYMQQLKRLIRQRRDPLKEIVARLLELDKLPIKPNKITSYRLCTKPPNNVFMTKDGHLVELLKIRFTNITDTLKKTFLCRRFLITSNFFTVPCQSTNVGIYQVDTSATCHEIVSAGNISRKCFKMNINGVTVIQTLLHDQ